MNWIYLKSDDNKYRYALGKVEDNPRKLLFCFGINPSTASPEALDPTAKRIERIATEHGYDSWIILNLSAERTKNPDKMCENQLFCFYSENFETISNLLHTHSNYSDVLFAFGNAITKRNYLQKNLCKIINIIKTSNFKGECFCLGFTKLNNPKHPLYQKASSPFVSYSLDGHTYSEFVKSNDNNNTCVIREYSDNDELIFETFGTTN